MESVRMMLVAMMVLVTVQMLHCSGATIGVNYGRNGDNLPSPKDVVSLYKRCGVERMRIFEPFQDVFQALRSSGILLSLGVRNEDLKTLATSMDAVRGWVDANIVPYKGDVIFGWVTLGNEVIPGPDAQYVASAMINMRAALDSIGLTSTLVTTVVSMNILGTSYPPSVGAFNSDSMNAMKDIAFALRSTRAPLLLNVYPYFAYASNPTDIPLDYAMFNASKPVVDGSLEYHSLFDAMIDSVYAAMEKIGVTDVRIAIGETGWPSGGSQYASTGNAQMYNSKLYNRLMREGSPGTPKKPQAFLETFYFAMFNENLKPAGVEQNFGLFYPNMAPVYPLFKCQ